MATNTEEWDEIGYILSSKLRLKLLLNLVDRVSTPSLLSNSLKESHSRISITLQELVRIGAVECLTPTRRKGKLYTATSKGKEIIKKIHELTRIS